MKTNQERLNELFKKHGLVKEDSFKSPQGWSIITRSGIDKIQASAKIEIAYDMVVSDTANKTYVIKATAKLEDREIQTYGESSPDNTRQKYPVSMAEKRAMSRAVLKLAGFYEVGAMGQDESDDFQQGLKEVKSLDGLKPNK